MGGVEGGLLEVAAITVEVALEGKMLLSPPKDNDADEDGVIGGGSIVTAILASLSSECMIFYIKSIYFLT